MKNILGVAVVGAALITVGILLTTSKGKSLRRKIAKRTADLADQLSQKIEEGKALLTDLQKKTESAKNKVTNIIQ
jgi:hypothetical protein